MFVPCSHHQTPHHLFLKKRVSSRLVGSILYDAQLLKLRNRKTSISSNFFKMTSKLNKGSSKVNIESCLKMLSTMQQFHEATMKLRLEVAEMQLKMLSLYNAPSLQLLQLLVNIPGSCQMDDSIPQIDEPMDIITRNDSK